MIHIRNLRKKLFFPLNRKWVSEPGRLFLLWGILPFFLRAISVLTLSVLLFPPPAAGGEYHQILLLNSYHRGFTWTDEQVNGILPLLQSYSSELELYIENLDLKRFPDPAHWKMLREQLRHDLSARPIELILTTDNLALDFALAERNSLFPGVPIVFSGVNGFRPQMLEGAPAVTGVIEEIDPAGTLEAAFRLQPQADKVLVVIDGTETGVKTLAAVKAAASRYAQKTFDFLENPALEEVLAAVRQLPQQSSLVLLGNFNRDANGKSFSHEEVLARIAAVSPVPIYGLWDFLLGKGIVGGSLLSGRVQGEHAASLATRILAGETKIPVETTSPTRLVFDAQVLQRFGLDARSLPISAEVINRPVPFFARNRALILVSGAIILALGGIIVLLLTGMAARRKTEEEMRAQAQLLAGIISHIPHAVFWKDRHLVYLGCNENFARRAGVINPAAVIGKSDFDLAWRPEEAERYRQQDRSIVATGEPLLDLEQPQLQADGVQTVMLSSKVPLRDPSGAVIGILGLAYDITDRKQAETALADKSYLLQTIIDALPAPIFYKDREGLYLGCNRAFESFLGLSRDKIVGCSVYGIAPKVLADKYFRADNELLAGGGTQIYEAQSVYADGSRHDVLFHKAVFTRRDGGTGGLVGAMIDITERKNRERELEALARLTCALRSAYGSPDLHRTLLACLFEMSGVSGAFILQRQRAEEGIVMTQAVGACASMAGTVLPSKMPQMRTLFGERRPCEMAGAVLQKAGIPASLPQGMEYLACIPMLAQEGTVGALGISAAAPFSPADLRLLGSVAEMGANAIQRTELRERTELQLRRLSTLQNIDRAIISSHDFGLTMETLLEQTISQMGIDASSILLYQPRSKCLEFAAGRGFRTALIRNSRIRVGEGIAGRAVQHRRLEFVSGREELLQQSCRGRIVAEEEFAFYCGVPLVSRGEVKGILEIFHRTPLMPEGDWLDFLQALGMQAAIAIDNAMLFEGLQQTNRELMLAYDRTIEGWSRAMDLRDSETEGHSRRVTQMTLRLARQIGIAEGDLLHLRRGALLHDIGKMGIPDAILLKPGPLTAHEWEVMKTHPKLAFQLLSPIEYLRPALEIPYGHHEKWDGSGYPMGLAGEEIPLSARIFTIVDVWDALLSDRPYRPGWPVEKVRQYLREQAGHHFDPRVVESFLAMDWKVPLPVDTRDFATYAEFTGSNL